MPQRFEIIITLIINKGMQDNGGKKGVLKKRGGIKLSDSTFVANLVGGADGNEEMDANFNGGGGGSLVRGKGVNLG